MSRIILIIILYAFSACTLKSYATLTSGNKKTLLCSIISDTISTSDSGKLIIVNNIIKSNSSGEKLFKHYLAKNDKTNNSDYNVESLPNKCIDGLCVFNGRIEVTKDQSRFDSLAYMYWLVNAAEAGNFIGMPDSVQALELKKNTHLKYMTIEFATPLFYNNYALVSYRIIDGYSYAVYQFIEGEWKRLTYLQDPR